MRDLTHVPKFEVNNNVKVQCPECYKLKDLRIPMDKLDNEDPILSVYLESGVVCEHQFYFVTDKNMKVRSFINVDYEIPSEACD